MLVFFTKLSLVKFQVRYFALFCLLSVIDSIKWFWMGSLHKNIQLTLILGSILSLLYINDFHDDGISNIAICADDTTFFCESDKASDLWQQLKLAF